MWEVKKYEDIIEVYLNTFKQLKKFYDSNRLIMIYGNHDMVKKYPTILKKYFYQYHNIVTFQDEILLDGLIVHESFILKYKNYDIFLIHGHQVDFINSTLWRVSRFFVRYVWKPLEHIGLKDFTGVGKNHQVTKNVEKKLEEWSSKNNKILIAGHTHRAIFPKVGQSLYFNDGSCVHSNGITCIEIESGSIALVRWEFGVKQNGIISVERKILNGKEPIIRFLG